MFIDINISNEILANLFEQYFKRIVYHSQMVYFKISKTRISKNVKGNLLTAIPDF